MSTSAGCLHLDSVFEHVLLRVVIDTSARAQAWILCSVGRKPEQPGSPIGPVVAGACSVHGLASEPMKKAEMYWSALDGGSPASRFACRLRELREQIVASGEPLLSWDEIHEELARRRGEIE